MYPEDCGRFSYSVILFNFFFREIGLRVLKYLIFFKKSFFFLKGCITELELNRLLQPSGENEDLFSKGRKLSVLCPLQFRKGTFFPQGGFCNLKLLSPALSYHRLKEEHAMFNTFKTNEAGTFRISKYCCHDFFFNRWSPKIVVYELRERKNPETKQDESDADNKRV